MIASFRSSVFDKVHYNELIDPGKSISRPTLLIKENIDFFHFLAKIRSISINY